MTFIEISEAGQKRVKLILWLTVWSQSKRFAVAIA